MRCTLNIAKKVTFLVWKYIETAQSWVEVEKLKLLCTTFFYILTSVNNLEGSESSTYYRYVTTSILRTSFCCLSTVKTWRSAKAEFLPLDCLSQVCLASSLHWGVQNVLFFYKTLDLSWGNFLLIMLIKVKYCYLTEPYVTWCTHIVERTEKSSRVSQYGIWSILIIMV